MTSPTTRRTRARFAARYGSGGAFWRAHPELTPAPVPAIEIWNEPDNPEFWSPAPDPAAYARMYLAARSAIDGVDPAAACSSEASPTPPPSSRRCSGRDPLRGHVDGVALHPYGTPAVVLARVRGARAVLVSVGIGTVPLYVTEFGWTTQPPGAIGYAPAAQRPADIERVLTALGHLRAGWPRRSSTRG